MTNRGSNGACVRIFCCRLERGEPALRNPRGVLTCQAVHGCRYEGQVRGLAFRSLWELEGLAFPAAFAFNGSLWRFGVLCSRLFGHCAPSLSIQRIHGYERVDREAENWSRERPPHALCCVGAGERGEKQVRGSYASWQEKLV